MKRSFLLEDKEPSSGSKKRRRSVSEDESLGSSSKSGDSLPLSKIYNSACRNNKPAELFRKDLISAMKLPDSEPLDDNDFWNVTDTWKQEWERGVQVPVNSRNVPLPDVRVVERRIEHPAFKLPKKLIHLAQDESYLADIHVLSTVLDDAEKVCRYDLDDTDYNWLQMFNEQRIDWGLLPVSEEVFELIIQDFEIQCFNKFQDALKTEQGLGIEYDDDVICDVCRNPECEEGNEMVFCDICNICVHQACYGITAIPEGSWVCRTCAANVQPTCVLCPNKGGAMKSTRKGDRWAHVSCALWIPEVVINDPEKMEPISKISQIPPSRWALICTFCRERVGACIQCCVKQCKVAYHVTCAFENGLEISAVYNESKEEDGVKLKSYCVKHGGQNREGQEPDGTVWRMKTIKKENKASKVSDLEKHNARLQKIREMEAEFYKYVDTKRTSVPHVDQDLLYFVYNYWKLKRTANYNKPLLPTKLDEAALLGKQPEDSLYARMKMFVHLRQDLERVRNLCYMVSRREKLRRTYIRTQKDIFDKQADILGSGSVKRNSKEYDEVLAATHGDSLYDCIYFGAKYHPPKTAFLKVQEPEGEKKKLASASRLPNPYAKLYFNGIHTRSRRHSTTSDNTSSKGDGNVKTETNEEAKPAEPVPENVPVKIEGERVSSYPVVIRIEAHCEQPPNPVEKVEPATEMKEPESMPPVVEVDEPPANKEVCENQLKKDSEPSDQDACKENIPAICDDVKKNVGIIDEELLSDIKNSPSQSDKENVIVSPKARGRRAKSQSDVNSNELSKIVKDNLVIKLDKQNKPDSFKGLVSGEALKSSNARSCRYEMRSRNNSTSLSPDEASISSPEKPVMSIEDADDGGGTIVSGCETQSVTISQVLPCNLSTLPDDSDQKDEEEMKQLNETLNPTERKARLRKRRTRRRLFKKISYDETLTDTASVLNVNGDDSCTYDELPMQQSTITQHFLPTEHTEYKMTLGQNGKVLLSSLKKVTLSDHVPSDDALSLPSSLKDSCKKNLVLVSSSPRDLSCDSSDSLRASSSSRDRTSSPRLVIKLVKDRERQQWQKQPTQSEAPTTFKVVRNDWEMALDSKDLPLTDALESLEAFDADSNGHRYLMRSRSKQNR